METTHLSQWRQRFPELYGLFGNYLFEDWSVVYPTPMDAIRDGVKEMTARELAAVLSEIDQLLALNLSDQQLDDVLYRALGSYVNVLGQTRAEWLQTLAAQLRETAQGRDG